MVATTQMSSAHLWECLRKNGSGWTKLGGVRFRRQGRSLSSHPRRSHFVLAHDTATVSLSADKQRVLVTRTAEENLTNERASAKVREVKCRKSVKTTGPNQRLPAWVERINEERSKGMTSATRVKEDMQRQEEEGEKKSTKPQ